MIGANTIVEVSHSRTNTPRLNWALSCGKMEPVPKRAAKAAAELLKGTGLHGHTCAIDATVAEIALRQPRPVALLTSTATTWPAPRQPNSHHPPLTAGPPGARVALPALVSHPCRAERTTAVRYGPQRPGATHLPSTKSQVRAPLPTQAPLVPQLRARVRLSSPAPRESPDQRSGPLCCLWDSARGCLDFDVCHARAVTAPGLGTTSISKAGLLADVPDIAAPVRHR